MPVVNGLREPWARYPLYHFALTPYAGSGEWTCLLLAQYIRLSMANNDISLLTLGAAGGAPRHNPPTTPVTDPSPGPDAHLDLMTCSSPSTLPTSSSYSPITSSPSPPTTTPSLVATLQPYTLPSSTNKMSSPPSFSTSTYSTSSLSHPRSSTLPIPSNKSLSALLNLPHGPGTSQSLLQPLFPPMPSTSNCSFKNMLDLI